MTKVVAAVILLTPVFALLARAQAPSTNATMDAIRYQQALATVHTNWVASPGHVLAPGDVVEVKVYQEDDLNTHARVENNGIIAMPLLGQVKVGGLRIEQARKVIQDLLQKDYLQNPQVTLSVAESAKRRFCIMGEVRQPGFYMIPDNETMTILQAISQAGGYTTYAQPSRTTIKRTVNGVETIIPVDAKDMARKKNVPIIEIEPNDTIVVNAKLF